MKLASFCIGTGRSWGVVAERGVYDCSRLAPSLDDFVQRGKDALKSLEEELAAGGLPLYERDAVRLDAPLRRPGKLIAIGLNYRDHCRETNSPEPTRPIVFAKFRTAIIGTGDEIRWSRSLTDQVDWEVELGVVIGKTARNVTQAEALDYVYGYTVVNDVSARELQSGDGQWVRAKSLDTFCPMGPVVVTADEIPDPQRLRLWTRVNGQAMQDSNTSEMIFTVSYLIEYLSRAMTLEPGDVIATGTPHGVGVGMKPPVFLKDGDVVEVGVEGIGELRNICRATE